MYAKTHTWTEKGMVNAEIYASEKPSTMPLTTDDVDGVDGGYKLAPGSVFYVVSSGDVYILGTNDDWTLQ
jgi:hypothetical protein